ncbi:LuxR C-terminal-related transcriptional regulator [Altererythrobacter arenosus]|uniref:LuxR C-terminal-related transcriptional regulator n=1 Tax=Altererythrobacter arenosus TaxID=3032592 RepID=A0ABY8FXG1_9SPHN|nr:LuxR C-terminal-related transcriptional regulator [Altererythrobacter sp. CAU 1644]WFL78925.1 LuxR C-terminal-related transcriptional regulator [Altererythrobacter sp. CAU 1644]
MSPTGLRGRPAHPDILTPAEWRVAEGVRHGLTNQQIARRQEISANAVKFHVSNILSKLGMRSRAELKRWPGIDAMSAMQRRIDMVEEIPFGTIGQIARSVSDIEESRRWYRDVLGLEPLFDAGTLAFFACNGVRLMLTEGEAAAESLLYFRVDDLHGEFARLEERGAKVLSAPHRIHTHEDGSEEWMGFVEDNDGRPLALMSVVPAQN